MELFSGETTSRNFVECAGFPYVGNIPARWRFSLLSKGSGIKGLRAFLREFMEFGKNRTVGGSADAA
jgi:hypothetical protein